jgi:hypothetical protein
MGSSRNILRTVLMRASLAMALFALLFSGSRVNAVVTSFVGQLPPQQNMPHEEEDERHQSNAKATSEGLRRTRPPTPMRLPALMQPAAKFYRPSPLSLRELPAHESDLRNGLGAPLRC